MPGPVALLRARRSSRAYYLREVGRDLGHRLVVGVVALWLLGLVLRLVMG